MEEITKKIKKRLDLLIQTVVYYNIRKKEENRYE
jgi:hypothetical protein